MEREAIVAWLRDTYRTNEWAMSVAIESGEHLRDAPTEPKGPCGEVPGFACFCCEPKGHEGAHVCGCSTVPHVAWLRDAEAHFGDARDYADDIERGEHLRGDDE